MISKKNIMQMANISSIKADILGGTILIQDIQSQLP
jgi:hypothetical protein